MILLRYVGNWEIQQRVVRLMTHPFYPNVRAVADHLAGGVASLAN